MVASAAIFDFDHPFPKYAYGWGIGNARVWPGAWSHSILSATPLLSVVGY